MKTLILTAILALGSTSMASGSDTVISMNKQEKQEAQVRINRENKVSFENGIQKLAHTYAEVVREIERQAADEASEYKQEARKLDNAIEAAQKKATQRGFKPEIRSVGSADRVSVKLTEFDSEYDLVAPSGKILPNANYRGFYSKAQE